MQLAVGSPWVAAASPHGDLAMWDWRRAIAQPANGASGASGGGIGSVAPGTHAIHPPRTGLSALALHPQVPCLASGSRNQFIKIFDARTLREGGAPKELHTIRYFDGFLGARIAPVTCLAFHPTRVLLAVGATDSVVSIYSS